MQHNLILYHFSQKRHSLIYWSVWRVGLSKTNIPGVSFGKSQAKCIFSRWVTGCHKAFRPNLIKKVFFFLLCPSWFCNSEENKTLQDFPIKPTQFGNLLGFYVKRTAGKQQEEEHARAFFWQPTIDIVPLAYRIFKDVSNETDPPNCLECLYGKYQSPLLLFEKGKKEVICHTKKNK